MSLARTRVVLGLAAGLWLGASPAWAQVAPASDDEDPLAKPAEPLEDPPEEEAPAAAEPDTAAAASDVQGDATVGQGAKGAQPARSFRSDRFFVEKIDTAATEDKTLLAGNFVLSGFYYSESGGDLPTMGLGTVHSSVGRMYVEGRAQVDAKHVAGKPWAARLDGRARMVLGAGPSVIVAGVNQAQRTQAGALGRDEYEVREASATRTGERTDLVIGRQFIDDVAAIKIDGVRLTYARTNRLSVLGFAGLFPSRNSRSLTTDYPTVLDAQGQALGTAMPFTGGAGLAYRTEQMYGALGAAGIFSSVGDGTRVFVTSNGYLRGSKFDVFHYLLMDVVSDAGTAFANLSVGANYRPSPALRLTLAAHRYDIDTLSQTARSLYAEPNSTLSGLADVLLKRLASTHARLGASYAMGATQRFELSAQAAYRMRDPIEFANAAGQKATLPGQVGLEILVQATDRKLAGSHRVSLQVGKTLAMGDVAFDRSESLWATANWSREFAQGRAQAELEAMYAQTTDAATAVCAINVADCYGAASNSQFGLGGTGYYRVRSNLFVIALLNVTNTTVTPQAAMAADPGILGLSGFVRVAYRY